MTTACPSCGTPRMGSFRFCRSCGFDYEPMASNASPSADPTPAVLTSAPETAADVPPISGASFRLPASEAAAPVSGESGGPAPSAGDVIAVPVEPLKRAAGAIIGGLIGAMLAGAVIVPFLGDGRIFLAVVATIVTISVAALLGVRVVVAMASR